MRAVPTVVLIAVLIAGCGGEEIQPEDKPLLDGYHEPDVLVEAKRLALPPDISGNRWVHGFRRVTRNKRLARLVPREEGGRLEFVNLQGRERTLSFVSTVVEVPEPALVEFRVGSEDPVTLPISEKIDVPLTEDLPLGRVPVDVLVRPGTVLAGRRVDLSDPLRPGRVEFGDSGMRQTGWSAVDFYRWLDTGTWLLGRFQPPPEPEPDQEFVVSVEDENGTIREVFRWSGSWLDSVRGARELRVAIAGEPGPHRLRFLATGVGPPGTWRNLRIREAWRTVETSPIEPPRVVIFYLFDALRADYVPGFGGSGDVAPTLARLGAEGVVLARHFSIAPNTKPSIKSLFSGRAAVFHGHSKLPEDGPPTLADKFRLAGFRTAAFSGSPYVAGWMGTTRGFEHQDKSLHFQVKDGRNASAELVQEAALAWLRELDPAERAFVYVHSMNPHNPYAPPDPYPRRLTAGIDSKLDASTGTLLAIKRNQIEPDPADEARIRALYASGIAYNDAKLDEFMQEVAELFDPGEVLVVFTADHGDELFEHDGVLHGYTLYEDQVHIPLLFWWPGVLQPARVERVTDHLDLHATLSQMVGAEDLGQGAPFWDLLQGEDPAERDKRVVFASASGVKGGIFMARSGRHKLIWAPRTGVGWGMGQGRGRDYNPEYLFDLDSDPAEKENLAGSGSVREGWLRSQLLAWVERGRIHDLAGEMPEMDEETVQRLKALGYLD